jgi:cysteine-rich repeat protein
MRSACLAPIVSLLVEEAACGDGTVDAGEDCDDGNVQGGDGCSAGCRIEPGGCR